MSTFTLEVAVDPDEIPTLKNSKYNLCLGKRCNDVCTVIWSGNAQYLANNVFEWTDEYQVFGVQEFKAGAAVQASTDHQEIEFGQSCEITEAGVLTAATGTADESGRRRFTVVNKSSKVNVGVSCKFGDEFRPIFVSTDAIIGTMSLEPSNVIEVWFSSADNTSGTMIEGVPDSKAVQVKYSGRATTMRAKYRDGEWSITK